MQRAVDLERFLEIAPAAVGIALLADQLADAIERNRYVGQARCESPGIAAQPPAADLQSLLECLERRVAVAEPDV